MLGWDFEPEWRGREAALLAAVAAVERGVAHPVARALASPAESGGTEGREASIGELRVVAGRGVEARVAGVGTVRVGEREFCTEVGEGTTGTEAETAASAFVSEPGTRTVWVSVGGRPAARARLGETWRIGIADTVVALRADGVAAYATMDAGPHLKCLVAARDAALAKERLARPPGVLRIIEAVAGEGARIVEAGAPEVPS